MWYIYYVYNDHSHDQNALVIVYIVQYTDVFTYAMTYGAIVTRVHSHQICEVMDTECMHTALYNLTPIQGRI
jgi:hypothetical protein